MKKGFRSTKYLNVFLGIIGGGLVFYVLFVLGYNILAMIIYRALESGVETPKICASNELNQSSEQTTPPAPFTKNPQGLELVGHIGGSVQSVFTTGSYAYVSIGPEIAVLDISNPSHPKRVGYIVLPDKATDIYVEDHYAYAAVGKRGIRIIDVSNPAAPFEVGAYSTPVPVYKVIVSKGYAYLPLSACNGGGSVQPEKCAGALQIVDVSNPTAPVQVGCHETPGLPISVAVDGNYAYISNTGHDRGSANLLTMDISDPTMASEINIYDTTHVGKLAVADNYTYVATGYDGKFQVLDVSNRMSPAEISLYDSGKAIHDFAVLDKYVYLNVEDIGIQVLDISNSTQPLLVSTYAIDNEIKDISFVEGYVVIVTGNNELQIIDVTNPFLPIQTGSYESPKSFTKLEATNSLIYAATADNELRVIDASNPNLPFESGQYKLPEVVMKQAKENDTVSYISDLEIEGNQAYLAIQDVGIQTIDISNPFTPVDSNFYFLTNGINDMEIHNNSAYISTGSNGIEFTNNLLDDYLTEISSYNIPYDVKDIAVGDKYVYMLVKNGLLTVEKDNFTEVDFYELDLYYLNRLITDGKYIYIASDGIMIIELLDNGIPNKGSLTTILKETLIEDIVVEDDYLYAAVRSLDDLQVINISNPLQPVIEGSYTSKGTVIGLEKKGNYVYLGSQYEGIKIIDVSNPKAPLEVGSYAYDKSTPARSLAMVDHYIYFATGPNGLQIIDVANPTMPIEIHSLDKLRFVEKITIVDNYAYVSLDYYDLLIMDITKPYQPLIVKEYENIIWKEVIAAHGNYAYLVGVDGGLWKVDINIPSEIKNIYKISNDPEKPQGITGIDVRESYIYVVAGRDGLRIVDISETANEVGVYQEAGINAHDVAVSGNLAYIANGGLLVVDVSNPSKPVKIGSYELPIATWGMAVDGEYIYIASGTDGIFIFHYTAHP
ncbi:MAG: hypothetical protein HY865_11465 [Chloroflexi bacterium]|nr:hypothetical protein [Chloroflexota bacterium]